MDDGDLDLFLAEDADEFSARQLAHAVVGDNEVRSAVEDMNEGVLGI
jgi:hypothetical protein